MSSDPFEDSLLSKKIASLDPVIEAQFTEKNLPGLAVGVILGGHLVYFKGLGYANIKEKVAVKKDTVFRLASISKLFTTVAIMQQWEKGVFDLDEHVNDYLPVGKLKVKPGWPAITFKHLLTHQSGIGELLRKRDILKPGFGLTVIGKNKPIPPLSSIHEKDIFPEVPAGSKYAYSNIGFSVLGYLLEQFHDGTRFRDIMVNEILDPLNMKNSDFERTARTVSKEAVGYMGFLGRFKPSLYYKNIIKPAGNLYSTMQDMSNFAAMILSGGILDGKRLLAQSTVDKMLEPHYWAHDALKMQNSIGLCFHLYHYQGIKIAEHTGGTSGFTSVLSLLPEHDLAILVFGNLDEIFSSRGTIAIRSKILQYLFGSEEEKDFDTPANPAILKKIQGYYGPYPGILTNTRIHMSHGSDFKVVVKKNSVWLHSFLPSSKSKVRLHSTSAPYVYDSGKGKFVFLRDKADQVVGLAFGYYRMRKNILLNTFRCKVYTMIGIGMIIVAIITILVIL